jgi:hypothetical protein
VGQLNQAWLAGKDVVDGGRHGHGQVPPFVAPANMAPPVPCPGEGGSKLCGGNGLYGIEQAPAHVDAVHLVLAQAVLLAWGGDDAFGQEAAVVPAIHNYALQSGEALHGTLAREHGALTQRFRSGSWFGWANFWIWRGQPKVLR